jgi:hypothetical protein
MMSLGMLMDMIKKVHEAEAVVGKLEEELFNEQISDCGCPEFVERRLEEAQNIVDMLRGEMLWF